MYKSSLNYRERIVLICCTILFTTTMLLIVGCGSMSVRHVPKIGSISAAKMSDLRASQPIHVKAGEASSAETAIGTVGVGKVIGKMSEWTGAVVGAVKSNLSTRGATLKEGAPKAVTITMTKAEVKARPIIGGANCRIALTATSPDGLNKTVEGTGSSMAPLGSVDEAAADAVKKLLSDTTVDAYLRK